MFIRQKFPTDKQIHTQKCKDTKFFNIFNKKKRREREREYP